MTDEKPRRGRPATGTTPLRNIRIPDDLWNAAKAAAKDRGETLTAVCERALVAYVAKHQRKRATAE